MYVNLSRANILNIDQYFFINFEFKELRNDRDMMLSADTPFVDGPTTQDGIHVIERTSRSISRQVC